MAHNSEWDDMASRSVSGNDSRLGTASDPMMMAGRGRGDLGVSILVRMGRVQDAIAGVQAYRVVVEGGPAIQCGAVALGSLGVLGPRPIAGYAPGAVVLVAYNPRNLQGLILGAVPPPAFDPRAGLSDFVFQGSRCGIRVDEVHAARLRGVNGGGIIDYSAGRPLDSLPGVEWGAQSETGSRILLDPFLAQVAVDEATGVFVHYLDQMIRLGGVNLREHSAGHVREWLLDQGEISGYFGWTPYPWEQMGVLDRTKAAARSVPDAEWQVQDQALTACEPKDPGQRPFHRVVQLYGYLGQAGRRLVQAPPDAVDYLLDGKPSDAVGLADQAWTLDGKYMLRTARGIFLEKTLSIPAPTRVVQSEDPDGDAADDDDPRDRYRFAGVGEDGPDHKVAGSLTASEQEDVDSSAQRAAASGDAATYMGNFEVQLPISRHAKDWDLPEDAKTPLKKSTEAPIQFADLESKDALDAPDPIEWKVDDRYGKVQYFPNRSYIRLLDDGGMALGCGFGAEIRLHGGKIYLDAPGDVIVRSGRTTAVLAGHDVVLRAQNSADLTAAKGDVRIKSEVNFQLLAGNGGDGGVLIESRGSGGSMYRGVVGEDARSGGITLKSTGVARVIGQSLYLRSGVPDATGQTSAGPITIDAGRGGGDLIVAARNSTQFVSGGSTDVFLNGDQATGVHSRGGGGAVFSGGVYVTGSLAVNGGGYFTGGVSGTSFSGTATHAYSAGMIGSPTQETNDRQAAGIKQLQETIERANHDQVSQYGEYKTAAVDKGPWGDGGDGADDVLRETQVSLRTAAQYRTEDMTIWEARWQQMARMSGQELPTWKEPPVRAGSTDTMPWPGAERWTAADGMFLQDLLLHDHDKGAAKDRDDQAYKDAKLADPTPVVPDDAYTIIISRD